MDAEQEEAKRIVTEWFLRLWIERPSWLTAIPDQTATQDLIDSIAASLRKQTAV